VTEVITDAAATAAPPPNPSPDRPARGAPLPTIDPALLVLQDDKSSHLYNKRLETMQQSPKWASFCASVEKFGVVQPVLVRRDGDQLQLIAGHRRTVAARLVNESRKAAGKPPIKVPYVLQKANDVRAGLVASLENEQREANTPLQTAHNAQALLQMGASDEEAALALGISEVYLKSFLLPLLDLDDSVQDDIKAGVVADLAMVPAAGLSREDQKAVLAEEKAKAKAAGKKGGKVSTVAIKAAIAKKKAETKAAPRRGPRRGPRTVNATTVANRPSIKETKAAYLGAQVWVAEPTLYKLGPSTTVEQVVAELVGHITGEIESELFDFLVQIGSAPRK
jgi:ParB/RepB/Spo0J family partition protein